MITMSTVTSTKFHIYSHWGKLHKASLIKEKMGELLIEVSKRMKDGEFHYVRFNHDVAVPQPNEPYYGHDIVIHTISLDVRDIDNG